MGFTKEKIVALSVIRKTLAHALSPSNGSLTNNSAVVHNN